MEDHTYSMCICIGEGRMAQENFLINETLE